MHATFEVYDPRGLGTRTRKPIDVEYQVELEASNHNDGIDSHVLPCRVRKARAARVTPILKIFTVVIEP